MKSRLVGLKGIFGSTKFVAKRTSVSAGLYMIGLNVLPQPHFGRRPPSAIATLPLVPYSQHSTPNGLILEIYSNKETYNWCDEFI